MRRRRRRHAEGLDRPGGEVSRLARRLTAADLSKGRAQRGLFLCLTSEGSTPPAPPTVASPPPCGEGSGVGVPKFRSLDRARTLGATSSRHVRRKIAPQDRSTPGDPHPLPARGRGAHRLRGDNLAPHGEERRLRRVSNHTARHKRQSRGTTAQDISRHMGMHHHLIHNLKQHRADQGHEHPPSRDASRARVVLQIPPSPNGGREEGRTSAEARGPPAEKKQAAVTTGTAGQTRPSPRDGFNKL